MAQQVLSPRTWEANKAPGYISWLNSLLNQRSLVVNDLSRDLRDGVILLNLIEIVTGKNVDSLGLKFKKSPVRSGNQPFPKSREEQLENVRSVFKCLEHFNIKTVGCEPEDIVDGNAQLLTALIFSFKKYAKDNNANINVGPTTSYDTSTSTSTADTTTKNSKSVATTTLNGSAQISKNSIKDLDRSYRGGSGSAQNSLTNIPNTSRSRSGKKGINQDELKLPLDENISKIKKTDPIKIDQIHRSTNIMISPRRDLVGEIRDQLDETQRDLEFTESPSKHIWELNKLIHKAKEMEKELLQGERKRIQLTPPSQGVSHSSERLLESPTSLRPIVDATGFDAVHEKVALQLNEAAINSLMGKMKQQKTTRNSNKNVNLEDSMKKFRSNSIIQQKYNFARNKQLKFQRRSRTEYPLTEGRGTESNRSTLFKVKVSQPSKTAKDSEAKNSTKTTAQIKATEKVAEEKHKVVEKLRRKSRAGLKKSKTMAQEDKPTARGLRKSSSLKAIKPAVLQPTLPDVLEVSETAASKEEDEIREHALDHNSDAGSDAEASDSSSSSEVSRLEFGSRHIRRTGSLNSSTSTGSAIKPASHNHGSVTHSPVVPRAASSPQGLLVANAKGILNVTALPLPAPIPKQARPRSGAMTPVNPDAPPPNQTSALPSVKEETPPGPAKVAAPSAKAPGNVKIGSAKGQPPKAGFKPGTAPSKTGVKQGPPPKSGAKQAPTGPKKVVLSDHQREGSTDSNSGTGTAFQRVVTGTTAKQSSSPVLSRVASFNAAANQAVVSKPRPESPVRVESEVSVASLVDSFTSNSSRGSSPEPTRVRNRDLLSPMRLSVRTGELDRVVSRTNSMNEFSESMDASEVSFTKDSPVDQDKPNNATNSPKDSPKAHSSNSEITVAAVEPTPAQQDSVKVDEKNDGEKKLEAVEPLAAQENNSVSESKPSNDETKSEGLKNEEKVEPKKEIQPVNISVKILSSSTPRDQSPGRTQYSKSVSVAKIGKGAVKNNNNNNNERPQLERKKSKTTDDITPVKLNLEELENPVLTTSGDNDSENSSPTPRRKRSFSDMSNIVVSNTKQKELEETNEEVAKKAQIQRQQSKNILKSFYKSLKHSFASTSKRNLAGSKEIHQNNNDAKDNEHKEDKKTDQKVEANNNHDEKAHKKDKKEKKMHKQTSVGNMKDKDKIKSKSNKSATSPNINNNANSSSRK